MSETKEPKQCLQCVHMYPFVAKEDEKRRVKSIKYVCCLHGKRIIEEPENCKDFKEGVRP